MFKILKKYKANKFLISDNQLVLLMNDEVFLYKDDILKFHNTLNGNFTSIYQLHKEGYLIRKDDNTALVLASSNEKYQLSSFLEDTPVDDIDPTGEYILYSTYLSYYPIEVETKLIRIKDGITKFSSKELGHYIFIKDVLIIVGKENMGFYQLPDLTLKSQIQIAPYLNSFMTTDQSKSEDKIQNYIGLAGSVIWLGLSSGRLLAVNIEKGSLEYQIRSKESRFPEDFSYEVKDGDYLPFGELMQLDEKKGEIFGLRDKYFMKIDLNNGEIRREYIDIGKSMEAHDMSSSYRSYTFPCDEQLIYFCDDRKGKIGVFDRLKQEVVWSYELEMERDGIAQILEMKYSGNRWYVLDRNNTLHIFEREI